VVGILHITKPSALVVANDGLVSFNIEIEHPALPKNEVTLAKLPVGSVGSASGQMYRIAPVLLEERVTARDNPFTFSLIVACREPQPQPIQAAYSALSPPRSPSPTIERTVASDGRGLSYPTGGGRVFPRCRE
jgi:hypothetical protein